MFVWTRGRLHASGELRVVSAELLPRRPHHRDRASVGSGICHGTNDPAEGGGLDSLAPAYCASGPGASLRQDESDMLLIESDSCLMKL